MKLVPFGEVATFINGRAFKPEEWEIEGLPIIRIQNLTGSSSIVNYYSGKIDSKYLVEKGDILISWSASLGVYIWEGDNAILNQHIFKVIPRKGVDKTFFYYAATHVLDEMISKVHGSTMQHITKDPFESTLIPLPPLPEQQRIAAILQKADRLRQLRRYARQLRDTYLQSLFLEMFGDPVTNPMKWTLIKVEKIIDDIRYGTGSPPPYYDKGIPFIRATNIKKGTIQSSGLAFISKEDANDIPKCKIKTGDLILVRSGINTGDCGLIPSEFNGSYAAYDLIIEMPFPYNYYFNFFINSSFGKNIIQTLSRRSGQPHVNAEQIKNIELPFPSKELLNQFSRIIQKIQLLFAVQVENTRQTEHLFQSLLQRAFQGKL